MFIEIRVNEDQPIQSIVEEKFKAIDCNPGNYTYKNCCRYPLEVRLKTHKANWKGLTNERLDVL